jgi:hypothetical protein
MSRKKNLKVKYMEKEQREKLKRLNVLEFKKDINGNIKILAEVHESKNYLMIFNAMRKKKAQRRPDATKMSPGAHVQDAPPLALTNNLPQQPLNVKGKKSKG